MNFESLPPIVNTNIDKFDENKKEHFNLGQVVNVQRTNGDIENDWTVGRIIKNQDRELVEVFKNFEGTNDTLVKKIPLEELLAMQTTKNEQETKNGATIDEADSISQTGESLNEKSQLPLLSEIDELIKNGLATENDKSHLVGYSDCMRYKREAQQEGDGEASRQWGESAGYHIKNLSDEVRKLANTFEYLYNKSQ